MAYETGYVKVGAKFLRTTEAPLADVSGIEGAPQVSEFDTASLDTNIPVRIRAEGQLVMSPTTGEIRRFAEDKATLLPARVGSTITYRVPALGPDRFVTEMTFNTDGELLSRGADPSFRVPAIGSLRGEQIFVGEDGEAYWVAAERSLRVPKIGDAAVLFMGSNDLPIFVSEEEVVDGSGGGVTPQPDLQDGFELGYVYGTISGRPTAQLMFRRAAETWTQLTLGPDGIDEVISVDAGAGKAVVSLDGVERTVTWRPTPLPDQNRVHLILVMGQSLAVGFVTGSPPDDNVPWRDLVHPERAWQFQSADGIQSGPRPTPYRTSAGDKDLVIPDEQFERLEPLRGAHHRNTRNNGQTCAETAAGMLVHGCLDHHDHVIGCVIGTGATSIVDFLPGTEHMQSAEKAIAAAYAWGRTMNLLDLTVWLVWNQGGEDILGGMAKSTYKTNFLAIRDHLQDFVENHSPDFIDAIFGGAIIQQNDFRVSESSSVPGMPCLAHAELMAEGEAGGLAAYAFSPGRNSVHYAPRNYFPLGSATGYEIARGIENGNAVDTPVHIAAGDAVLVNSTTIDITWSGGSGSYQFDTTQIPNFPDGKYGLSVDDDSGGVGIETLVWQNATTLRLTLSRATAIVDNPIVGAGMVGASYNGLGDVDFLRVNVRDTSSWTCPFTGQVISGWAILQQVAVVAAP